MLRLLYSTFITVAAVAQVGSFRSLPGSVSEDQYQALAEQGDAEAQNNMGLCALNGNGCSKDSAKALFWFKKAAAQGHIEAMYNLGNLLTGDPSSDPFHPNTYSIPVDFVEGAKWIQKAAENGYIPAQSALTIMYSRGIGVTADPLKAKNWKNKVEAQKRQNTASNDPMSQVILGDELRAHGKKNEAVKWYSKAADQGYPAGINALANCYYWGYGVKEDIDKAIELYEISADKGDEKAGRELNAIRNSIKYQSHMYLKNQKNHPSTGAAVNNSSSTYDWAGHRAAIISQCGLSQTAMRDPAMQNLVNAYLDYSARCERAGIAPTDPNRINAESSLIQNIFEYKYNRGY